MATLDRFLEPPRLRTASAERYEDRHATWLELFLDLVFVVAIAELGASLAADVTLGGFLRYLAFFLAVWWAWAGFTFYATRFDTDDLIYRLLTLLGMFLVAALASVIPDAFLHGAANELAVAYALIRCVIVLLYVRAYRHVPEARPLASWFLQLFSGAIVLWFVSLAVPSPWKFGLWAAALGLELAAPPRAWRLIRHAPIHPSHIPERFGLLTIIVLGEAVLAVVIGTADVSWSFASGAAAFGGFLLAVSIWWVYFEFLDASMVGRGIGRGMTFVYAHYFVASGIAMLGVGVRLAILSLEPGPHLDHAGWVVCAGTSLCMLGLALVQLATPPALFDLDVWLRLATAALAAALAALTRVLSPVIAVWLLALVMVVQVLVELVHHEHHAAREI